MRYGIICFMFLANNAVVSLMALAIMGLMLVADILKERMG